MVHQAFLSVTVGRRLPFLAGERLGRTILQGYQLLTLFWVIVVVPLVGYALFLFVFDLRSTTPPPETWVRPAREDMRASSG